MPLGLDHEPPMELAGPRVHDRRPNVAPSPARVVELEQGAHVAQRLLTGAGPLDAHLVVSPQSAHLAADLASELPASPRQVFLPARTVQFDVRECLNRMLNGAQVDRPRSDQLPPPAGVRIHAAELQPATVSEALGEERRCGGGQPLLVFRRGHRMVDVPIARARKRRPPAAHPGPAVDERQEAEHRATGVSGDHHRRSASCMEGPKRGQVPLGRDEPIPAGRRERPPRVEHGCEGILPVYQLEVQAASREHLRKHSRPARYRIGCSPTEGPRPEKASSR